MNKTYLCFRICHLLLLLITAGCASQSGWITQSALLDFIDGARIPEAVVFVTINDEILAIVQGIKDLAEEFVDKQHSLFLGE